MSAVPTTEMEKLQVDEKKVRQPVHVGAGRVSIKWKVSLASRKVTFRFYPWGYYSFNSGSLGLMRCNYCSNPWLRQRWLLGFCRGHRRWRGCAGVRRHLRQVYICGIRWGVRRNGLPMWNGCLGPRESSSSHFTHYHLVGHVGIFFSRLGHPFLYILLYLLWSWAF